MPGSRKTPILKIGIKIPMNNHYILTFRPSITYFIIAITFFKIQQSERNFFFYKGLFFYVTSVDTEMCCPKGKCGCQYFILLT